MIGHHVAPMWISLTLFSLFLLHDCQGKVFTRCELAKELVNEHEVSKQQVATWVCIAEHESQLNTSAVGSQNGDGSKDHGLLQISDQFWCSPPGNGWACGVTCDELRDDDISDDIDCARRIYREHKLLTGDGFNAWAVYHSFCAGSAAEKYIEGCFDEEKLAKKLMGFLKLYKLEEKPTKEESLSKEEPVKKELPSLNKFIK